MRLLLKDIVILAPALVALVSGLPTSHNLSSLATPNLEPDQIYTCGVDTNKAKIYSIQAQKDAASEEEGLIFQDRKIIGSNGKGYPEKFYNGEKFVFPRCSTHTKPFMILPILRSGKLFLSGDDPGPDRVVVKQVADGNVVYCGLITHIGSPTKNGFLLCKQTVKLPPSSEF